MGFRVVIPTAGTGSRLGNLTKQLNKSLIDIANRPAISHIIEKFPKECDFVIPIGHKGELVEDFLNLAYPEKKFYFVKVNPFKGKGSGLGHTLLACEELLQQPFVFISCDTIIKSLIPEPNINWMAYAECKDFKSFRSLKISKSKILKINEKNLKTKKNSFAYIGLAGIKNYKIFWQAMKDQKNISIKMGEVCGLRNILKFKPIHAKKFIWFDTGNKNNLNIVKNEFLNEKNPNILHKENEAIWFVKNKVIKYSSDNKFIVNRVIRSEKLKNFVPKIISTKKNMYSYHKQTGIILSKIITVPLFLKLLKYSKEFWEFHNLNKKEKNIFNKICRNFYEDKTYQRINIFYEKFKKFDLESTINDEKIPKLSKLLNQVNWELISEGLPGRFHGDFHFENILYNKKKNKFIFLDWRQDFGGNMDYGDIYYDLAKLLHGLIISHEVILNDDYRIDWTKENINYNFYRSQINVECEIEFENWCNNNNFNFSKVKILTALIFLNISPLHHFPYSLLLYSLGKKMLKNEIQQISY